MAEDPNPFTKLKEQITCPVCLDVFTQPKLLACTHAFCMDCINQLEVDGDNKIYCPTCREPTTLPCNGSAALRPAFHINTLIELYNTAVKLPASVTDKPKDKKCLEHDRSLEMYCDDCQKVLCTKCAHADHRNHNCDYIADIIDKHQQKIDDHLLLVTEQLSLVLDALHDLDTQQEHIATHAESVKNQIDALINQLVQTIRQSGATLKQNVDTLVQHKLNNIVQRKEEGEMFLTLLESCEQYVQDKLRNGSQQEILLEKNEMLERLGTVSQQLTSTALKLKEKADIVFRQSQDILEKCSKIGEVSIDSAVTNTTTPNSCIVSDKATLLASSSQCKPLVKLTSSTVAIVGRPRSIDIKVSNISWLDRFRLSCHLVADVGGVCRPTQCEIKHVEKEKYRISFTATHQGLHHVKVQVKGTGIPCDPCTIQVATAISTAYTPRNPTAIATTTSGLLVVAGDTSIAVMDKKGYVISISDTQGGGYNTGICVIPDDYILVVSSGPPHITKYTMDCGLVSTVNTSLGSGQLQFNLPQGIAVCSNGHIYMCDTGNHHIQVLNPDLTFSHVFGERGSGPGQFMHPRGIAIDSQDTIYVCDNGNDRIQKLSSNGTYISEFSRLLSPRYIAVDNGMLCITTHDTVVVCTTDGEIINEEYTLPHSDYEGVAVDKEYIFVCDYGRDQIIFINLNAFCSYLDSFM